jgi:peptidoglycan hydrolase-like protein with peptidoglycan-binding domain
MVALITVMATTLMAPVASANHEAPKNGPDHNYGDMVDYPLTFPVGGINRFSNTFFAQRGTGTHHAADIMAAKMTPVLAAADGVILRVNGSSYASYKGRCCTLAIRHDDGWESVYIHLNNDTPGTDDGQGWGIAPGIELGVRVRAGQVIGYVGDSGNAEGTSPHLHFELYDEHDVAVNPYDSLRRAEGQAVSSSSSSSSCSPPEAGSLDALFAHKEFLRRGDAGQAVRQLQRFLAAAGFSPGAADGVLGPLTENSVKAFQRARGLTADGVVGPQTQKAVSTVSQMLGSLPALDPEGRIIRPGYRGQDVRYLQELLTIAGYNPGPIDGVFGPLSQAALSDFQDDYGGLTVDGKLGPNTRSALADYLGLDNLAPCG